MTNPFLAAKRQYYDEPKLEAIIIEIAVRESLIVIVIGNDNWGGPVGHHHKSRDVTRYVWNDSDVHKIFALILKGLEPDNKVTAQEYRVAYSSGCALIFRIEILH